MTAAVTSPTASTMPASGPGSGAARAVADRVEELAGRPPLARRRARLEELGAVLRDRNRAEGWTEVDLHAALGYPVPGDEVMGNRTLKWLDRLAAVRVILVFVPVVVTWLAVHQAAVHYRDRLARDPDLPAQSFFRLWLDGFGGEMWLSFPTTALIIALTVGAIIALSSIVDTFRSGVEFAAAQRQHTLQEELNGVLAEASVHLARGRASSPEGFLDELTRAAEGLSAMVTEVRSAAVAATDAMQAAETATAAAQQAAAQAHDGATELARSVTGLTDSVARTGAAADAAATTVADAVDGSMGRFANVVSSLQETVSQMGTRAAEDRENIGTLLREHRQEMHQQLPDLADQIAATQAAALAQHLSELRTAIAGLTQTQQSLATAIKRRTAVQPSPAAGGVRTTLRRWFGG